MASKAISSQPAQAIDQACAIPFRLKAKRIEFCLITASSGRWMFPKGFVEPSETFEEAALKEALEEAGLHGRVIDDPIGYYEIQKKGQPWKVVALLMEVSRCDSVWKEVDMRNRRWATPKEARKLVSGPELRELIEVAETRLRAA